MASETNTDRISRVDRLATTLVERVDNQRQQIHDLRSQVSVFPTALHEIDKRLAVVERDAIEARKRLEELDSRSWEVRKMILTAIVGGIIGSIFASGAGISKTMLDRWIGAGTTIRDTRTDDDNDGTLPGRDLRSLPRQVPGRP
jgi:hypothetical protein